jgi:hypothetical protein
MASDWQRVCVVGLGVCAALTTAGAPGVNAEFRFEPTGEYTVVVLANTSPPAATELLNAILGRLNQQSTISNPK